MSSEPNAPTPVVVILLAPVSIVPKPLVILPVFKAPVLTRLGIAVISSSKYAAKSVTATCTIVPLSFITTRSASATVVEVAEVPPSTILSSAAVESTAANLVKSACTKPDTPSRRFNSAAVDVTAVEPSVSCPSGTIRPAAPLKIRSSAEVSQVMLAEAVSPYRITS